MKSANILVSRALFHFLRWRFAQVVFGLCRAAFTGDSSNTAELSVTLKRRLPASQKPFGASSWGSVRLLAVGAYFGGQ